MQTQQNVNDILNLHTGLLTRLRPLTARSDTLRTKGTSHRIFQHGRRGKKASHSIDLGASHTLALSLDAANPCAATRKEAEPRDSPTAGIREAAYAATIFEDMVLLPSTFPVWKLPR